ncbi:hypothetical protein [Thermomonas sp. HDW16]|nr:hypothetical protein [Thermomonas sp. HDW16]QIL19241.1 hypothetical protein G7079_02330 [Thermomonas sp. HDW16]
MREHPASMDDTQAASRRAAARRTALLFAAIAVAVYAGFILIGVVGR